MKICISIQVDLLSTQTNYEVIMEFEKFKRYIESIQHTYEKEETLSNCIQENITTSTFCIVDISEEVISSLVEILVDYYDCHFEVLNHKDNDIAWWLYTDEKIIYITDEKSGKKTELHLEDVYSFWKYLEDGLRNKKCNKKGEKKKNAK